MRLLIVVDYQVDFVSGVLGCAEAERIENAVAEKIREYRGAGGEVAFTIDRHSGDYTHIREGKSLPYHCAENTEGERLYGEVARLKRDTDRCFYKSCYGSAQLFDFLRGSDYEQVELAGLVSNICVLTNAVLAQTALPDSEIIIDSRCTASGDKHLHKAALDVLAGMQIKILNCGVDV